VNLETVPLEELLAALGRMLKQSLSAKEEIKKLKPLWNQNNRNI